MVGSPRESTDAPSFKAQNTVTHVPDDVFVMGDEEISGTAPLLYIIK